MATVTQKTISAGGVLVSVATGIVTNLVTDEWSWTLGGALAVLTVAAIWLAIVTSSAPPAARSRHEIRSDHHGLIKKSGATGREGAVIKQTATRHGTIENSRVIARHADVEQEVDNGGRIVDSPSDMQ
ncbi:hypothetical protein [Streptomyces cyaneofuscatus]|uniref:hypothetical protein n=1 Tax=Streptomyces cyaneofuscatus TaxID=66883 RepID=UPI0013DB0E15|nr:hypothetical protein [Streptomyces cyaneofuscatus]NDZ68253.1 hypothetical protein [Streptomyces cyaneofuscatus]